MSYVLNCADANAKIARLRWLSWTRTTAVASGLYSHNNCTPDCAAGRFLSYAARISLSNPFTTTSGLLFTRASIRYRINARRFDTVSDSLSRAPLSRTGPTP